MPLESEAQNRWAHTEEGTKALGGPAKVKEWERATDYSHLPKKKGYAQGGPVERDEPNESAAHEAKETPAEEAWEQKTGKEVDKHRAEFNRDQKGQRTTPRNHEHPARPSIGGMNDGHGVFAQGGPVLKDSPDRFYKTKDRGPLGQFLSTADRFSGGRMPAGFPEESKTEENWSKPKGIGQTDKDDAGDCKSLKPVLPNKAGYVSYAKSK